MLSRENQPEQEQSERLEESIKHLKLIPVGNRSISDGLARYEIMMGYKPGTTELMETPNTDRGITVKYNSGHVNNFWISNNPDLSNMETDLSDREKMFKNGLEAVLVLERKFVDEFYGLPVRKVR